MALDHILAALDNVLDSDYNILQLIPLGIFKSNDKKIREGITAALDRNFHDETTTNMFGFDLHDNPFENNVYEFFKQAYGINENVVKTTGLVEDRIFGAPRLTWKGIEHIMQVNGGDIVLDGNHYTWGEFLKSDISIKNLRLASIAERPWGTIKDIFSLLEDYAWGDIIVNNVDRNRILDVYDEATLHEMYYIDDPAISGRKKGHREMYVTSMIRNSTRKAGVAAALMNIMTNNQPYDLKEVGEMTPWWIPFAVYGEGDLEIVSDTNHAQNGKHIHSNWATNLRPRLPEEVGGLARISMYAVPGYAALGVGGAVLGVVGYTAIQGIAGLVDYIPGVSPKLARTFSTAASMGMAALFGIFNGLPWYAPAAGFGAAATKGMANDFTYEGFTEGSSTKQTMGYALHWVSDLLTMFSLYTVAKTYAPKIMHTTGASSPAAASPSLTPTATPTATP